MRIISIIVCVSLLLLVGGCAQKVNAPADVEAVASLMTEKTAWYDLNTVPMVGKDAIRECRFRQAIRIIGSNVLINLFSKDIRRSARIYKA
jgi:hypothetical protein